MVPSLGVQGAHHSEWKKRAVVVIPTGAKWSGGIFSLRQTRFLDSLRALEMTSSLVDQPSPHFPGECAVSLSERHLVD
jgi:hypothetical protein